MREHRTLGLVLRVWDYGESDRLVHLYTETEGRVSAIAKGARRSKRRFPGTLEILTLLETQLVDPPRSSMLRFEAARVIQPFERFTNDLRCYALACQVAEILDRYTGEREASPELFRFVMGVLGVIAEEPPDRWMALLVRTKTLARLGYCPQLISCAHCATELAPDERSVGFLAGEGGVVCPSCTTGEETRISARLPRALEAGLRSPLRESRGLRLRPAEVEQAEILMDRFFRYHIDLELRTAAFLRGILGRQQPGAAVTRGNSTRGAGGRAVPVEGT